MARRQAAKGVVSRITGSSQGARERAYRSAGYGGVLGTIQQVPRNLARSVNGAARGVSGRLGRARWQVFGIPFSFASAGLVAAIAYYVVL